MLGELWFCASIYDSNGLRRLRILELSGDPNHLKICINPDTKVEFIEVKTDNDLYDVVRALMAVSKKQYSDKMKETCVERCERKGKSGKCSLPEDIIVSISPYTDYCSHFSHVMNPPKSIIEKQII